MRRCPLNDYAVDHRVACRYSRGHDVDLVDTPVAGHGMFGIEEGTMTVLVGDDGELVTRLEPTLRRFASRVVPAGRIGSGAALKLAHNIVVYAGFAAMIEAVELAARCWRARWARRGSRAGERRSF